MVHLVLNSTSLDTTNKGLETQSFQIKKGSPQEDSIIVIIIIFLIYLEDSVRRALYDCNIKKFEIEHLCSKTEKSSLSKEIVYADDTAYIFKTKEEKNKMIEPANALFPSRNLKINEEKTERTFLHRRDCITKTWRNVKKAGYLLGDFEDITRRKQLAISSTNKIQVVWIRRDKICHKKRLRLHNCLVLPVFLYNCST